MVNIPRMSYIEEPQVDYSSIYKSLGDLGNAFIGDDEIKQKEAEAKARRDMQPENWAAEYNLDPGASISNSYDRLQQAKDQLRMKFKDIDLAGGKDREAEEESSKVESAVTQGIFALLGPALGYMLGGNKMAAAGAGIGMRGAAQMGEIAKRKEATAATERLAKEAEYTGRMGAIAGQEKILAQQAFKKQDRENAQADRFEIEELRQGRADARAARKGPGGGSRSKLEEEDIETILAGYPDLTPEQRRTGAAILRTDGTRGMRDYYDQLRKGGTADLQRNKFERQVEGAELGSWKPTGPVSNEQAKQAQKIATGVSAVNSALGNLKKAVGNRVSFTGNEATQRAQAYSAAEFALQAFYALGANFTESEQAKINNMLPLVGDLESFIKGELTARDAVFAADNLISFINQSAENSMRELKYVRKQEGASPGSAASTEEKRAALRAEMAKGRR